MALALGLIALTNPSQADQSSSALLGALVIVRTSSGSGSGFVVQTGNRTYVISNEHVLRGQNPVFQTMDGRDLAFSTIEIAQDRDLVRVPIKAFEGTPLQLSDQLPNFGDPVTVYGNSGGQAVVTRIEGKVQGVGPDRIEVDAKFIPGNSGSPILDAAGRVTAVATYMTSPRWGSDWVFKGTRFTQPRRFGIRMTDTTKWNSISLKEYQQQVGLLGDFDTFITDAAPVFMYIYATHMGRSYEVRKATGLSSSDLKKLLEFDYYQHLKHYNTTQDFCQIVTQCCWALGSPVWIPKKWNMPSGLYSRREKDRLFRCLYSHPRKLLSGTQWATPALRQDARDRLEFLWEIEKEVRSWMKQRWWWREY